MNHNIPDKNTNLRNVLKNAVINRDAYYEEGLISYILTNIDKESLSSNITDIRDTNYFKVHSNFWGLVSAQYYHADLAITDIEYFKKYSTEDKYLQLHNKAVEQQEKYQNIKNNWKKLLNQAGLEVEDNPTYYLSHAYQGLKHVLNYKDWLALSYAKEWIVCYTHDESKWKITDSSEQIFAQEIIKDTYSHSLSYLKKEEYNTVVDLIIKHKDFLKQDYKISLNKPPSFTQEEFEIEWLNKLLYSSTVKKLIEECDISKVSELFDGASCRAIIDKAKIQKNIENHPEMLSNLLGVASPESWIKAYSTGKNFNLLSFFNAKFKRGHAMSLTSDMVLKHRYLRVQNYIIEELEYLKPALINAKISEDEKLKFWTKVIQTENIDLIKKVSQCIALPDIDNDKSKSFYNTFEYGKITDPGTYENYTFKEVYKAAQYEELQNKIPHKTEQVKRKIKI